MKTTWGIMGLGKIAEYFAKALLSVENAELICASRNMDKAKEFGDKYHAIDCHGTYEDLVRDDRVDVIYVATPMSCHYENVKLCLEHGKSVLCEKAVTINAGQWEDLVRLAKEKNCFLMEAMWMKFLPSFLKIKEWYENGKIGELVTVKAEFINRCLYSSDDRLFVKALGGGALLDLGVYTLTFACDFLGYAPYKVDSMLRIGQSGVDFFDSVLLKYENGSFAELTSSFDILSENRAYLVGTKGSIMIGPWFHCAREAELFDQDGKSVETYQQEFLCNGYEYEIMHVQDCLNKGLKESPVQTHEKTHAIMKIMDEIRYEHGFVYEGQLYEPN